MSQAAAKRLEIPHFVYLLTYAALWNAIGTPRTQGGETVEPVGIAVSLVVLTSPRSLACLRVVLSIPPLLALLTTLGVDLSRGIVVVVIKIKTNALIASVVNGGGILCGSTPVVETGGSVTPKRISHAIGIQAIWIPDPPRKGYWSQK